MAQITDIAEANKLIDELRDSLEAKNTEFTTLQTQHSDLITANGKLVKEKAELWELVASGKKAPAAPAAGTGSEKEIDLDALDM